MKAEVLRWRVALVLACREHHVPPALAAAVMDAESGGNPAALSPVGAIGLMQLMPGTASGLGVDPHNPGQNLVGGVRYLRQQFDAFGDWELAVAAYNAGPNAVLEYGAVPPYDETERYVRNVSVRVLDYLTLEADLIWGADPTHAPATGSHQEAAANLLGIAEHRKAQIAYLREVADRALSLA